MTPTMSASATAKQSEDQLAKVQAFQEIEHDDNKHKIFVQQHWVINSNLGVLNSLIGLKLFFLAWGDNVN